MKTRVKRFVLAALAVILAAIAITVLNNRGNFFSAMAAPDDKYKALDTFSQALGIVENAYVEPLEQKEIIYGAIKGMLHELDPHSSFYTPEQYKSFQEETKGAFGGLGITISMQGDAIIVIAPIEDTPAYKAGIQSGDAIVMIENEPTAGLALDEAVAKMRGEPGTKVKITVVRKNTPEPIDFTLERAIIKIKSVKYAMANEDIGYVRLTTFKENSSAEIADALASLNKQGAKGIIFDLRNNPGGLLDEAVKIAGIFLPASKTVVYTKDRTGSETHYKTKLLSFRDDSKPMVIIVNEGSASAAEILAGAMQDYKRAVVIGATTFGKASVQSIVKMHDNSAIKITTARYYTPNGRSIQGVGIVPDIAIGAGKVSFAENARIIKEKDLSGHLVGENEKKNDNAANNKEEQIANAEKALNRVLPQDDDLQYISALQTLKGVMVYGKTSK